MSWDLVLPPDTCWLRFQNRRTLNIHGRTHHSRLPFAHPASELLVSRRSSHLPERSSGRDLPRTFTYGSLLVALKTLMSTGLPGRTIMNGTDLNPSVPAGVASCPGSSMLDVIRLRGTRALGWQFRLLVRENISRLIKFILLAGKDDILSDVLQVTSWKFGKP